MHHKVVRDRHYLRLMFVKVVIEFNTFIFALRPLISIVKPDALKNNSSSVPLSLLLVLRLLFLYLTKRSEHHDEPIAHVQERSVDIVTHPGYSRYYLVDFHVVFVKKDIFSDGQRAWEEGKVYGIAS